jgi:hypothetical protein
VNFLRNFYIQGVLYALPDAAMAERPAPISRQLLYNRERFLFTTQQGPKHDAVV